MSLKNIYILVVLLNIYCYELINGLDNGLARTPPMGWLTWQRFRCNIDCVNDPDNCISEHLIRVMTDKMVEDGYLSAGYEYMMVDDCWSSKLRDENNKLQPDPIRFPSGIRALADYVHSKGLKFGIYGDYGTITCGGYPGSVDHLQLDAETFADWTVDYLKFDSCYNDFVSLDTGYPLMSGYLNKTGRPIVFACSWPGAQVNNNVEPNYTRIAEYCNVWRNWHDIDDTWNSVEYTFSWYVQQYGNLSIAHGPGHFNDPDMLVIGNFGLSIGQSQTQMAIWSILAGPLIMSVDLRTIEPWARDILLNENMIAINQDKLGVMGRQFLVRNDIQMWTKPLMNNRTAFVFMQPSATGTPTNVTVLLKEMCLTDFSAYNFYEAFSGKLIGSFKNDASFSHTVNPSGNCLAFWAQPVNEMNGKVPLPYMTLAKKKIQF